MGKTTERVIAAAVLMRAMRLRNIFALGATPGDVLGGPGPDTAVLGVICERFCLALAQRQ